MERTKVEKHFDRVAKDYDSGKYKYSYYYGNLKKLLAGVIPKESKVLEIGCGTGDLLASLKPKEGYGMDISHEMVAVARSKHKLQKNLTFSTEWPKRDLPAGRQEFDYIFMSDVIEHLEKPGKTFKEISKLMDKKSKLVITMANPVWEPLLMFWEKMGWKMKEGPHNRIEYQKLKIQMEMAGMKIVRHDYKLLMPVKIPIITILVNRYLEKYLKRLAFIEYFIAVLS